MIETIPKYKNKQCRMPYLIDLVQDNVRSRIIYPMIIFVFFIFIIFLVITPPAIDQEVSYEVKPDTPFNSQYQINQEFQNSFPMPRVKFLMQGGPLVNETIQLNFKDLIIPNDGKRPNCDYKERKAIAGSLEYMRLIQVCKIIGTGLQNNTDSSGRATFSKIKIIRAPQGNYGIRYQYIKKPSVTSDELNTYLNSAVAKMVVMEPYAPQVAETGIPFID